MILLGLIERSSSADHFIEFGTKIRLFSLILTGLWILIGFSILFLRRNRSNAIDQADKFARSMLLLMGMAGAFIFLVISLKTIAYPFGLNYVDGTNLFCTETVRSFQPLYRDFRNAGPPYIISGYFPLYYWITGLISRLFQYSDLTFARTFGCLVIIACSVIIGQIVYSQTKQRTISVICALLFLSFEPIQRWGAQNRTDSLSLLFNLLGIFFFQRYIFFRQRGLTASAICLFLGILSKQSLVTAVLTCSISAIVYLDRQKTVKWFLTLLIPLFVVFVGLNILTHNGFYLSTVIAPSFPFSWEFKFTPLLKILISDPQAVLLIIWASVACFLRKSNIFFSTFFIISVLIMLGSIGRVGASTNYFFELLTGTILIFGISIKSFIKNIRTIVSVLLAYSIGFNLLLGSEYHLLRSRSRLKTNLQCQQEKVLDSITENTTEDELVLSDDVTNIFLAKRQIFSNDPWSLGILIRQGKIDGVKISREISSGFVGTVILHQSISQLAKNSTKYTGWPKELTDPVIQNFTLFKTVPTHSDTLYIYKYSGETAI